MNCNVDKIREAKRPKTKKEIQSFLGSTGYYRDFIPNYSTTASPLSDLTKKGQPNNLIWRKDHENAYNSQKEKISSFPILKLPDFSKAFVVRTDASNTGVGSVLLQYHGDKLFPICYASKKLIDQEKKFSTVEKECLAIIWAVKKFHNYLYGAEFVLETDHNTLQYLDKAKFVNARVMRWAMFLQQYKMKVQYSY